MGKTRKDRNYSFNHTKQRILERYNLEITREWYDEMCDRIINNRPGWRQIDLIPQDDDTQIIIELNGSCLVESGDEIIVVWSDKRQYITTALEFWRT